MCLFTLKSRTLGILKLSEKNSFLNYYYYYINWRSFSEPPIPGFLVLHRRKPSETKVSSILALLQPGQGVTGSQALTKTALSPLQAGERQERFTDEETVSPSGGMSVSEPCCHSTALLFCAPIFQDN